MATATRASDWLDGERAVAWRRATLAASLFVMGAWSFASRGGIDPEGKPLGTDFLSFWAAARLAAAGHPAWAWNIPAHWAAQRAAFGPDVGYSAFFYPPPFLLACLPLGLLPYFPALFLWLGVTGAAYLAVGRRWMPAMPGALASLLAFPAVLLNLGHGQNGLLTTALLGGGLLAMRGGRVWRAGLLLGALVIKPHLAVLLPVALAARREGRVLAATGLAAAGWCALSAAAFGADAWRGFLADSALARATLEQGLVEPTKMVSGFAAVRVLGGGTSVAYGVQALCAAAAIGTLLVLARRRAAAEGQDAVLVAATLTVSPFLLDYDLALMALPLAWLLRDGMANGFPRGRREIMVPLFAAPLLVRPLATALSLPLAPLATEALLALCAAAAFRSSPCRR